MTEYAVDTFAWIEYFAGTPIGERAREIIEDSGNRLLTPAPMLAEIRSKFIREGLDPEAPTAAVELLSRGIQNADRTKGLLQRFAKVDLHLSRGYLQDGIRFRQRSYQVAVRGGASDENGQQRQDY